MLEIFQRKFTWKCPVCPEGMNAISALSEAALEVKTFNHIRKHETTAALQAVDRARCECRHKDCECGKTKVFNFKTGVWEQELTAWDRKWLASQKIKWDGDNRTELRLLPPKEDSK